MVTNIDPPAPPTPGGPGVTSSELYVIVAAIAYAVGNRLFGDKDIAAQFSSAVVAFAAAAYALARGITKKRGA